MTATKHMIAYDPTCYRQWCKQHMTLWALHPAHSSGLRCGPPPPSALGSLQTCLCRCSQKMCRRYGAHGSSTMEGNDNNSSGASHKSSEFQVTIGSLPDLGDLYRVLCGSSSVVLNIELLHQFIEPKKTFSQWPSLLTSGSRDYNPTVVSLQEILNLFHQ